MLLHIGTQKHQDVDIKAKVKLDSKQLEEREKAPIERQVEVAEQESKLKEVPDKNKQRLDHLSTLERQYHEQKLELTEQEKKIKIVQHCKKFSKIPLASSCRKL